ncbi:hypothetical protein PR048_007149 [Dryococelus australis]|uniref:Uncharacterized protein n=1 Tax=Dryococelus australis TaxID=614101 RepID=A0ABQ9ICU5_9NEOP|nr:hypothetical protein PR048_007149 [Dryococelus australis]
MPPPDNCLRCRGLNSALITTLISHSPLPFSLSLSLAHTRGISPQRRFSIHHRALRNPAFSHPILPPPKIFPFPASGEVIHQKHPFNGFRNWLTFTPDEIQIFHDNSAVENTFCIHLLKPRGYALGLLTGFYSRRGRTRIFAGGNRAGRCRWSAGFLGDLPFLPTLLSGAAPHSSRFTLIGSQELDVESGPNLFTHSLNPRLVLRITGMSNPLQSARNDSDFLVPVPIADKGGGGMAGCGALKDALISSKCIRYNSRNDLVDSPSVNVTSKSYPVWGWVRASTWRLRTGSPRLRRTGFTPRPDHSRSFAIGNFAGGCRRSAGFIEDLPFPLPLHSAAAPFTPHFTFVVFQELVVKESPKSLSSTHSKSALVSKVVQCWDTGSDALYTYIKPLATPRYSSLRRYCTMPAAVLGSCTSFYKAWCTSRYPSRYMSRHSSSRTSTWLTPSVGAQCVVGNAMTGAILAGIPAAMADLAQAFTEFGIVQYRLYGDPAQGMAALTNDLVKNSHAIFSADVVSSRKRLVAKQPRKTKLRDV